MLQLVQSLLHRKYKFFFVTVMSHSKLATNKPVRGNRTGMILDRHMNVSGQSDKLPFQPRQINKENNLLKLPVNEPVNEKAKKRWEEKGMQLVSYLQCAHCKRKIYSITGQDVDRHVKICHPDATLEGKNETFITFIMHNSFASFITLIKLNVGFHFIISTVFLDFR